MPTGLFAGGPDDAEHADRRRMATRLLLLCAEADSVLLLDAVCGAPLVLARAGVESAEHTSLDVRAAKCWPVAAGESGEVLLLSARSLASLRRLPMPGMVLDVTLRGGHCACALPE
ncbi:MAG: hypothetical protein ACLUHE_17040 [Christensenellales bacterium]